MTRHPLLASILVATTALCGAAYAAEHDAPPTTVQGTFQGTAARKTVDRDVVKLSTDGAAAYRDMSSARLALFEAEPARAKTLIERARTALAKAKTDDAVFTKAEAALNQPAGAKAPEGADAAKAVAWLPVDGQLTLGEDFVPTPEKTAAIDDANHSLQSGDRKGAAEKLRLAGIDVRTTVAVLPLARTTEDVGRAATLIEQGKYYEANAVLKQAEDRMRFDVADVALVPDKVAANAPEATPPKQDTATHDQAKNGTAETGSNATPAASRNPS